MLFNQSFFIPVCRGRCPIGESDNVDLQACLEPFKEALAEVTRKRSAVDSSLFPLLLMTPSDLRGLCRALERSKAGCSFALQDCDADPVVDFANRNLKFVCSMHPPEFTVKNCIYFVAQNNTKCKPLLLRSDTEDKCSTIFDFFTCIEYDLSNRCGNAALAALVKAISSYGCSIRALAEKTMLLPPKCDPSDMSSISECFEPLEKHWMKLRAKSPMLNVVGFPIYSFESEDVERMCNLVHEVRDKCAVVQRCPSHKAVQFTNALLGYACGPEQQNFFLHFQCIQDAIRKTPECMSLVSGAWIPDFHKEVCQNMPDFFRCVHRSVLSECGPDSVNIVIRTIRQFWCDVGSVEEVPVPHPPAKIEDHLNIIRLPGTEPLKLLQSVETENLEERSSMLKVNGSSAKLAAEPGVKDVQPSRSKFIVTIHDKSMDTISNNANGVEANEVTKLERVFKDIARKSDGCSSTKLTNVRAALQPLFKKWLEFHKLHKLEDVDFPLYFYGKAELLELCDLYATAFLQRPFIDFQDCASDDVVFIANGMLGYCCSTQHVSAFTDNFDCIAMVVHNLNQCRSFITGSSMVAEQDMQSRCNGISRFYECAATPVRRSCSDVAASVFRKSIVQFGCEVKRL